MRRRVLAAAQFIDRLSTQYQADVRVLAVLRICFAGFVLINPVELLWVGAVPDAFFQPPVGPFRLLFEPPSPGTLLGLQLLVALLAAAVLVGYRTRVVSVLLTAALIAASGVVYSFGKVDHTILFELLPLPMAAAGWGNAYSLDARRGRPARDAANGYPVLLWGVVVGFALLSAALPKAAGGWLDPGTHATRGYLAREVADPLRAGPLAELAFGISWDPFWKLLDYGTVLVEGGLVLALVYPLLARLWLLALLGFHAGVYLTLGINFLSYVFVYVPLLAPWLAALAARVGGRRAGARPVHADRAPRPD